MQHAYFSKQFADQFRQETLIYPCFVEEQFQHLLFRQFAGKDNEIRLIGNVLVERLSDAAIIKSLMVQLGRKNIPYAFRLSWFVQEMYEVFYSYAQNEPYTASYFEELLNMLQPFYLLIGSAQEKTENLLKQLDQYFQVELSYDAKEIYYQDLDDIMADIEQCQNEISSYYNYFYSRLDQELEHNKGVALTSQVELNLLQLVSYTELVLLSLEDLQLQWEKWQMQIWNLETQEMYN